MRGVSNSGVKCGCGEPHAGRDGLCRTCRLRGLVRGRQKYVFTPALAAEVREAYCGSKSEVGAALNRLARRTGWPRHAFEMFARRNGLTHPRRPWTDAERGLLREMAGRMGIGAIASRLNRSFDAVKCQMQYLQVSARRQEGYTLQDLEGVFGASEDRVRAWYRRGLLGKPMEHGHEIRFDDAAVARFIRRHAKEYDLRRVDQIWFKALAFA